MLYSFMENISFNLLNSNAGSGLAVGDRLLTNKGGIEHDLARTVIQKWDMI